MFCNHIWTEENFFYSSFSFCFRTVANWSEQLTLRLLKLFRLLSCMQNSLQLIAIFKNIPSISLFTYTASRNTRVWHIERKEKKKRSIPNTRLSTLYVSRHDYRRGISETKKVTRRDASGIALFAPLPLLLFFPSFCGLMNHSLLGCRDSQPLYFLILILTLFSKRPQLKYCTSSSFRIVCN